MLVEVNRTIRWGYYVNMDRTVVGLRMELLWVTCEVGKNGCAFAGNPKRIGLQLAKLSVCYAFEVH